jgi:hypothetical protein
VVVIVAVVVDCKSGKEPPQLQGCSQVEWASRETLHDWRSPNIGGVGGAIPA